MGFALWAPPVDVLHADNCWFVKLELAGVSPRELEISARGKQLRIAGCRRDMLWRQGYNYHSLEINYSHFERRVDLPFAIDTDRIRWDYENGMLLIEIQCE